MRVAVGWSSGLREGYMTRTVGFVFMFLYGRFGPIARWNLSLQGIHANHWLLTITSRRFEKLTVMQSTAIGICDGGSRR